MKPTICLYENVCVYKYIKRDFWGHTTNSYEYAECGSDEREIFLLVERFKVCILLSLHILYMKIKSDNIHQNVQKQKNIHSLKVLE